MSYTKDQVLSSMRQADSAGDTVAAQRLSEMYHSIDDVVSEPVQEVEQEPTPQHRTADFPISDAVPMVGQTSAYTQPVKLPHEKSIFELMEVEQAGLSDAPEMDEYKAFRNLSDDDKMMSVYPRRRAQGTGAMMGGGMPIPAETDDEYFARVREIPHEDRMRAIQSKQDELMNQGRRMVSRDVHKTTLGEDVKNVVQGVGTRTFDIAGSALTGLDAVGRAFSDDPENEKIFGDSLRKVGEFLKDSGDDLGYEEGTNWEDLKSSFAQNGVLNPKSYLDLASYGIEQGAKSLPDMIAVMSALPAYVFARSSEMGEERAKNDGRNKAELSDIIKAAPFATASALFEKIGVKGMTGEATERIGKEMMETGFKNVAKRMSKGASVEASTEFFQEGVLEYVGEKWGTDAEMSLAEAFDRGFGGAVAGGLMGGGISGVGATVDVASKPSFDTKADEQQANIEAVKELTPGKKDSPLAQREAKEVKPTMFSEEVDDGFVVDKQTPSADYVADPSDKKVSLRDVAEERISRVINKKEFLVDNNITDRESLVKHMFESGLYDEITESLIKRSDKKVDADKIIDKAINRSISREPLLGGKAPKIEPIKVDNKAKLEESKQKLTDFEIRRDEAGQPLKEDLATIKTMKKDIEFHRGKIAFEAKKQEVKQDVQETKIKAPEQAKTEAKKETKEVLVEDLKAKATVDKRIFEAKKEGDTAKVKELETYKQDLKNKGIFKSELPKTETKEFKNWFGESKVVDMEGQPRVVFHGTDREFTEFKSSSAQGWGRGIYFTTSKKDTKDFGEKTIPTYLNIRNPFNGDMSSLSDKDVNTLSIVKERASLFEKKYDDDYDWTEDFAEDGDFANDILRGLGYDGIITEESNSIEGGEIVAFEPTQIKSTENRGTFDPQDPNIFKSETASKPGKDYVSPMHLNSFPVKNVGDKIKVGMHQSDTITIPKKPVSVRDARVLLGKISQKLNWYGTNAVVRRGTKGIYNSNGEYIQTAGKDSSEAAEIIPHELFHWLDETRVYKKQLLEFSKKMQGSYTYNVNAPVQENGAEFFRAYMTNAEELIRNAPEAVAELENILKTDKKMYKQIKGLQKTLHNYFHQPVESRATSKRVEKDSWIKRMRDKGAFRTLRDLQRTFRQKSFNSSLGMELAAKGNQKAFMDIITMADNVYSIAQRIMQTGIPKLIGGAWVYNTNKDNGMTELFDKLSKDERRQLGEYIDATRSSKLMEDGKERLQDDDTIAVGLSYGKNPKIKEASDKFHKFLNDLLDMVVREGGISAEVVKDFKDDWVSFARHMEFSEDAESQFADPLKEIVGGSQSFNDFESRVSSSIINLTAMAVKGKIKRSLYPMVNAEYFIPWKSSEAIEDIDFTKIAKQMSKANKDILPNSIMKKNKDFEMIPDIDKLAEYLKRNPHLVMEQINEAPTHPEYVIDSWIDEDGNNQFVAIPKGSLLAESVKDIGITNRSQLGKTYAPIKSFLSRVLIMSKPAVALPLVIADRMIHPIMSREYGFLDMHKAYIDGFTTMGKALINSKSFKNQQKISGVDSHQGGFFDDPFHRAPKLGDKERLTFTPNAIMHRMEAISKILEYNRAKKKGKTEAQAQVSAELMTARWRKHGSSKVATTATDIVPFLKAYVNSFGQELDAMFRSKDDVTKYSPKRFAEVMAKGTATIAGATFALYAWIISDDERKKQWDEMPSEDRLRNLQFLVMGDAEYSTVSDAVKVPFFFGSLFAGMAISIMDKMRKVDRDNIAAEYTRRVGHTTIPPTGVAFIDNFFWLLINKNPWNWGDIESAYMAKRAKSDKSTMSTPEMITDRAKDSDFLSPVQQDFLLKRIGGSWGKALYDLSVAETWKDDKYGEQPFVSYKKDDKGESILKLLVNPSKKKSRLIYGTVYSDRFLDMYSEHLEKKFKESKTIGDAKKKGTIATKDYYVKTMMNKVKTMIQGTHKQLFSSDLSNMSREQKVIQGMALSGLTYDTMTRVKYANTNYYPGSEKNDMLLSTVLKTYGGKTINTGFGKTTIPHDIKEYKKSKKEGGTKEAVMFALNRFKLERLKDIVQSEPKTEK